MMEALNAIVLAVLQKIADLKQKLLDQAAQPVASEEELAQLKAEAEAANQKAAELQAQLDALQAADAQEEADIASVVEKLKTALQ